MTGLDIERDALIEVAALVTDFELNVLGEGIDLVVKTMDRTLEALEHQQYTFGTLLQKLQIPRDASRVPLVSVTPFAALLTPSLKTNMTVSSMPIRPVEIPRSRRPWATSCWAARSIWSPPRPAAGRAAIAPRG